MWVFEDGEIHSHGDLHTECSDIVYIIIYEDGKRYLGKKTVRSIRRLKPTKKQLAIRKNYVRKEIVDLKFIDYEGSQSIDHTAKIVSKEILYQCSTKKTATYIETALLFEFNALFSDEYLNLNISGTYFDNSLDGLIEFPETRGTA